MAIRESLNQKQGLTAVLASAVLVAAVAWAVYQSAGASVGGSGPSDKAFFTSDDGRTWFRDSMTRVPPFDKDGKSAVGAQVFRCEKCKHEFVGLLVRYPPRVKAVIEEAGPDPKPGEKPADLRKTSNALQARMTGREVKRPGQAAWVPQDAAGGLLADLTCPKDGGVTAPVPP